MSPCLVSRWPSAETEDGLEGSRGPSIVTGMLRLLTRATPNWRKAMEGPPADGSPAVRVSDAEGGGCFREPGRRQQVGLRRGRAPVAEQGGDISQVGARQCQMYPAAPPEAVSADPPRVESCLLQCQPGRPHELVQVDGL